MKKFRYFFMLMTFLLAVSLRADAEIFVTYDELFLTSGSVGVLVAKNYSTDVFSVFHENEVEDLGLEEFRAEISDVYDVDTIYQNYLYYATSVLSGIQTDYLESGSYDVLFPSGVENLESIQEWYTTSGEIEINLEYDVDSLMILYFYISVEEQNDDEYRWEEAGVFCKAMLISPVSLVWESEPFPVMSLEKPNFNQGIVEKRTINEMRELISDTADFRSSIEWNLETAFSELANVVPENCAPVLSPVNRVSMFDEMDFSDPGELLKLERSLGHKFNTDDVLLPDGTIGSY